MHIEIGISGRLWFFFCVCVYTRAFRHQSRSTRQLSEDCTSTYRRRVDLLDWDLIVIPASWGSLMWVCAHMGFSLSILIGSSSSSSVVYVCTFCPFRSFSKDDVLYVRESWEYRRQAHKDNTNTRIHKTQASSSQILFKNAQDHTVYARTLDGREDVSMPLEHHNPAHKHTRTHTTDLSGTDQNYTASARTRDGGERLAL